MESINCIICDSDSHSPFIQVLDRFSSEAFQIVRCKCEFKYLTPRPEFNEISSYYEYDNYDPHRNQKKTFFDKAYTWVQGKALKWKYSHISKFIRNRNLLDIGGGGGEFCLFFQSKGWQVSLQDNSEKARVLSKENNIATYETLSEMSSQKFDLITMWHSLEHIHEISKLFMDIDRLICDNGILVIAVPNIDAPERKWFGVNWAAWDTPRHLYHFNYDQLNKLLLKYGWKIQYSKPMLQDTPYNILLSLKSNSPLQLISAFFLLLYSFIKVLIRGVNSSSSFMVICKKI